MRFTYQLLMPLLSLFFVRVDLTDLFPLYLPVKLVKVYDGDTVQVRHGNYDFRVRVALIDAPEKMQKFHHSAINAGTVSKNCLIEVLNGEPDLVLKFQQYDIYGRVLGDLNNMSFKIIANGCTGFYPLAKFSSQKEMFQYLQAFKKAKARKAGLWNYGAFIRPKMFRSLSKRIARQR